MIDPWDPNAPSPTIREDPSRIVPLATTSLTELEISDVLADGHLVCFGVEISRLRHAVAWAMICQETGRGKALHNNNFGNVDDAFGWAGERMYLTAPEGHGADERSLTKLLRSYPDALSGAAGWWETMRDHCGSALPFFDAGDGVGAAYKLSKILYFSGDVVDYARALRLMTAEHLRRFGAEGEI